MKIGELANKINKTLIENGGLSVSDFITPNKINGYKKLGLIVPEVQKDKKKSFFNFEEVHYRLILNAYKKIIFNKIRTREAFKQASNELHSPSLFD